MKKAALILLALLLPCQIFAQSKDTLRSMEEIVAIAYKTRSAIGAMQRITVDSTILKAHQSSSLADLLIQNSPINIKSYGRGNTQYATFRGTAASHTLVFWNGIKINSPMVGAVDFGQIPLFFVDKLSIDAGVSSMNTASGALGGSVNIESSPKWGQKLGIEAVQSLGSFTTSDSYLKFSFGNSKFQSATKLFYSYSKNDFEFVNKFVTEFSSNDPNDPDRYTYHPTQRNAHADYHRRGAMQELFIQLSPADVLTATIWGIGNNTNMPQLTTYEGDRNSNLTNRTDNSLRGAISYRAYRNVMDYTIRLTGDLQTMNFTQRNIKGGDYITTIDSRGLSRSASLSFDGSIKITPKHALKINSTAIIDYVNSSDYVKGQGYEKSRTELSASAALHSTWSPRLSTSIAGRAQMIGDKLYVTPFAGLEYAVSEPLSIAARVGYNSHAPSLTDLYYTPGGNPNLRPENSLTAELNIMLSDRESGRISLNIFNSWITDWIAWRPTPLQYYVPENIKQVLSQGVELSASKSWSWSDWSLYINCNLTLNSAKNNSDPVDEMDESAGKQLTYTPLLSGGLHARVSWKNLWFSYQIYGESKKYGTSNNSETDLSNVEPYSLSDITAGYSTGIFAIEARCKNIFNSQQYTILNRPLPGRNFEITLKVAFAK